MPTQVLSILGMLLVIAATLGLAYWFTKHIAGRGFVQSAAGGQRTELRVLGQLALGKGQRLLIVRLGQRCLLLGISAESITLLAELSEEEAAPWLSSAQDAPQNMAFLEAMRNILSQKK